MSDSNVTYICVQCACIVDPTSRVYVLCIGNSEKPGSRLEQV